LMVLLKGECNDVVAFDGEPLVSDDFVTIP
jgi:hypothetical protein